MVPTFKDTKTGHSLSPSMSYVFADGGEDFNSVDFSVLGSPICVNCLFFIAQQYWVVFSWEPNTIELSPYDCLTLLSYFPTIMQYYWIASSWLQNTAQLFPLGIVPTWQSNADQIFHVDCPILLSCFLLIVQHNWIVSSWQSIMISCLPLIMQHGCNASS